jgi:hypothetical protein
LIEKGILFMRLPVVNIGVETNARNKPATKTSQQSTMFSIPSPAHDLKNEDVFFKTSRHQPKFGMFPFFKKKDENQRLIEEVEFNLKNINTAGFLFDRIDQNLIKEPPFTSGEPLNVQVDKVRSTLRQLQDEVDRKQIGDPQPFAILIMDSSKDLTDKFKESEDYNRCYELQTGILGARTMIFLSNRNEAQSAKDWVNSLLPLRK